jgi:amino acid adenylation domain-containing protein
MQIDYNKLASIEFKASQYSKVFWLEALRKPRHEQVRYHIYGVFEYNISPDFIRLNDALQAVVNTNYNLRSSFKEQSDDLLQVVQQNVLAKLECYVVGSLEECQAIIQKVVEEPFNLADGPLFRFVCIQNRATKTTIFITNFHHIIIDGTQFDNLMREIAYHYHNPPDLTQSDIESLAGLQSYITWETEQIKGANIKYWLEKVKDYPLQIDLPYQSPLLDQVKPIRNAKLYQLDDKLYSGVQKLALELGCSIFEIMRTVWGLLICQYANQDKVIITYPFNTRRGAHKGVKGAFLNLCLFAFARSGSFRESINLQKKERRDLCNRYASMIELSSHLKGDLFSCAISQAELLIKGPILEDVPDYKFVIESGSTELCMYFNPDDASLKYGLVAVQNLFDEFMLDKLSKHLVTLLTKVVENPDVDLSGLSCLTASEYELVINQWNKTTSPYPKSKTISQLFEEQVSNNPKQTAVIYQNQQISYQEINARANQLANLILKEYIALKETLEDVLIPIYMEPGIEFIIAVLAILKSGAAYVPIDPKHPDNRIQFVLDDLRADFIITEEHLVAKIKAIQPAVKPILPAKEILVKEHANNLKVHPKPSNLAYVKYTSGTTGKPKGVMVEHRNVVSLVKGISYFSADESDTFAFFADVAFDAATFEIFAALLNGSRLYIPHNRLEILLEADLFKACLLQNSITVLWLTKTVFDVLYTLDEKLFASLKYLLVGGEALNKGYMEALLHSQYRPKYIINGYGPTENTTFSCTYSLAEEMTQFNSVPIGQPLANRVSYVLDKNLKPQPIGVTGELYVGGAGLARGYLNQEQLTKERFIPNPFNEDQDKISSRLYKTEDLVKWLPNGNLEYLGRHDSQVKLRGYRIELQEIEAQQLLYPEVRQAIVLLKEINGEKHLVSYYVADRRLDEKDMRSFLAANLPPYMVPSLFVCLENIPLTSNGKVDKNALPLPALRTESVLQDHLAQTTEQKVRAIWSNILLLNNFDPDLSFFDLGGDSLKIAKVKKSLEETFAIRISVVDLFRYTTLNQLSKYIASLADFPKDDCNKDRVKTPEFLSKSLENEPIAVVGMACRLPGGITNPQAFWELMLAGDSTIRDFSDQELRLQQVPEALIANESFVKRGSILENAFYFDANFFGYSEREAQLMDPQQRHFLECAWQALEHSGNVPEKFEGDIGVFASQGKNDYYSTHIESNPLYKEKINAYQAMLGNEKDFIATRVSFKLNLTGPSLTLQTGCSSSKNNQCDMALAGGVALFNKYGYMYQEDMIESPDGYCRTFDAHARGTVAGSGVGIVVLKRLADAIKQNDTIYAVIKGGALNNDGSAKIGYVAPSVAGQAAVIQKALKNAGITPDTIGYIETHGTGTVLGDPIEWAALHQVYEKYTNKTAFCALGAVKPNIGHTDAAAGVMGLIKAVLTLKNQTIPATLNFKQLNPEIAGFNKLFYVANQSKHWQSHGQLRRAAVSSFGIGGTNAHVILEEYLPVEDSKLIIDAVLIPFSAKNHNSLQELASRFKQRLQSIEMKSLQDLAYTAQQGRAEFQERGYFVVRRSAKTDKVLIQKSFIRENACAKKLQLIYVLSPNNLVANLEVQLKFLHWLCAAGVVLNAVVFDQDLAEQELLNLQNDIGLLNIKVFCQLDKVAFATERESIFIKISPESDLDEKYILRHSILADEKEDHNISWLDLVGWLWSHGISIKWNSIMPVSLANKKVEIPSYPYIRKSYAVPKPAQAVLPVTGDAPMMSKEESKEEQLKLIWSDVLGVPTADINHKTDFFEVGGDSIAFIDITVQIKKVFQLEVRLEEIVKYYEFGLMLNFIISKRG